MQKKPHQETQGLGNGEVHVLRTHGAYHDNPRESPSGRDRSHPLGAKLFGNILLFNQHLNMKCSFSSNPCDDFTATPPASQFNAETDSFSRQRLPKICDFIEQSFSAAFLLTTQSCLWVRAAPLPALLPFLLQTGSNSYKIMN